MHMESWEAGRMVDGARAETALLLHIIVAMAQRGMGIVSPGVFLILTQPAAFSFLSVLIISVITLVFTRAWHTRVGSDRIGSFS